MSIQTDKAGFYGDFSALAELKKEARAQSPDALRKAAQEFESLFTNMMLKSMRAASFGDALTGSSDMDFYQSMYDQQLATQLSKGKGMGLADMLVEQLTRSQPTSTGVTATPGASSTGTSSAPAATAVAPTNTSSTANAPTAQAKFVAEMLPHAEQAARKLGVSPELLVAHAALETGWGQHVPRNAGGDSSNNYFGIKANGAWRGSSVMNMTLEYQDGMSSTQQAAFRSYSSPRDTFADYSRVLAQPRYAALHGAGSNGERFANALQAGGYATDPHYADKLRRVIASVREMTAPSSGPTIG